MTWLNCIRISTTVQINEIIKVRILRTKNSKNLRHKWLMFSSEEQRSGQVPIMSNQDIRLSISVPEEERNAIGNSRKAKACSCRHRIWFPLQVPGWSMGKDGLGFQSWVSCVSFQSFCMQISLRISMHSCSSPLLLNKNCAFDTSFWILLFWFNIYWTTFHINNGEYSCAT